MIVFVIVYDSYVIKVFDVYVLDYLLKLVDDERFKLVFDKVCDYFIMVY